MRFAPRDVVGVEHMVEGVALREIPEGLVHWRGETPAPKGHDGRGRVLRALTLRPGLYAETVDPDKAFGVGVTERVGRVVGGKAVVVESGGAAPTEHPHKSRCVKAQAHVAGHVTLGLLDEGVQGLFQRREPHAVIDELGPARLQASLLVAHVALEHHVSSRGAQR